MDLKELVVAARADPAMAERLVESIRHDLQVFVKTRMPNTGGDVDDLVLDALAIIFKRLAERDVSELGDSESITRWCRVVAAKVVKDDLVARYRAARDVGPGARKSVVAADRRWQLEQRRSPPAARARPWSRLAALLRGWATRIRSVTSRRAGAGSRP